MISFKPNQPATLIRFSKPLNRAVSMLFHPMANIIRHSAIKNMRPASNDVHVVVMFPGTHTNIHRTRYKTDACAASVVLSDEALPNSLRAHKSRTACVPSPNPRSFQE